MIAGVSVGCVAIAISKRARKLPTGLVLVASFATAAVAYGTAGALGGSGFLAAYLAGLALGSADLRDKPTVMAFHEGLASVAEIGMFLALSWKQGFTRRERVLLGWAARSPFRRPRERDNVWRLQCPAG